MKPLDPEPRPRRWGRAALLATLGGVCYFLGFVGFGVWPLEFVTFVPVLFAIRGTRPRRALLIGTLYGLVTNLGPYYWIIHLLHSFADLNLQLSVLGYVLLSLYQGFLLALVVYLVRRAEVDLGLAPVWTLPIVFPALELAYPLLFPSFIGNAFYQVPVLTQFVDITGMLGLTAMICLVNGGLFELAQAIGDRRAPSTLRVAVPAIALLGAIAYGLVRLPEVDAEIARARALQVALVQTNLGAKDKWADVRAFIAKHQRMSEDALQAHPEIELLVWPESAYNRWLPRTQANVKREVMSGLDRPLIFGTMTYGIEVDGEREIFNTVVATSSTGDVVGRFDKVQLLAFGETIPFADTFPAIKKLVPSMGMFTRGRTFAPLVVNGVRLLPMICYEDIIPRFVRRMWRRGGPAAALVNVTNDSWYGDTKEPLIHLALATFRSIETRRALIRATNTGISAIVDPAGRIVARTGQWTEETLVARVPLIESSDSTIYMLVGDAYGWLAVAATVTGLVAARRKRKRRRRAGP